MTSGFLHAPVLLSESIAALQPRPGGRYIDATLGGGGHAGRVLELSSPNGMLLGIDADPDALTAARTHLAPFAGRFVLVESYFDDLEPVAREAGFLGADGVLFDLGVSSPQLGRAERGFSFQQDAPLDMRMGPQAGQTAANLVNSLSGAELQRIFQEYGEERYSGRIARRIVEARRQRPIQTTGELAEIVTRAKPRERHPEGSRPIHPATRVFQALRIAVNDELGRLRRALPQAVEVLAGREPDTELQPLAAGSRRAAARAEGPATSRGGRLAVITFHSLEDRIVKQFMRQEARGCICPPELPVCVCGRTPRLRVLTARPLVASEEEVAVNPRARSAKLRVAERISA